MSYNRFIASFSRVPREIFRTNNGPTVRLRAHIGPVRPRGKFDLLTTQDGRVLPKALTPAQYEWPNGASLRCNSRMQHWLVRSFKVPDACVYVLREGVDVPRDLILVHEFADHYSLQARKEMTVPELEEKIMAFLQGKGELLGKAEWMKRYPQPEYD
ncbi:hypothetical protein FQN57_005910 [Myotisia sp. PD_48]|nr:hypothetical protein FQN57_005910 [Myotisia sp. PD_48]